MPVTLASRAEIVKKMDQQFNDDLKMRQDTTTVGKEMLKIHSLIRNNVIKMTHNCESSKLPFETKNLSFYREPIIFQTT